MAAIVALAIIPSAAIAYVLFQLYQETRVLFGRNDVVELDSLLLCNLQPLLKSQREQVGSDPQEERLALLAAAGTPLCRSARVVDSRLSVAKKLRYAQWQITAAQFRFLQGAAILCAFIPAHSRNTAVMQITVVVLAPLLVMSVLDWAVARRFKEFDKDYPVMLMQLISMLKTGMSTITALQAAAQGLHGSSLVRSEIERLVEQLRAGVSEEKAISSFAEDIPHPEIELFVESLLIHMRVGGAVSSTFERLARQVRKRQQFREQAVAAVGMERTSIYCIAAVLGGLFVYMMYASPELVLPESRSHLSTVMFEGSVALILFGFYWSAKVTKIKV